MLVGFYVYLCVCGSLLLLSDRRVFYVVPFDEQLSLLTSTEHWYVDSKANVSIPPQINFTSVNMVRYNLNQAINIHDYQSANELFDTKEEIFNKQTSLLRSPLSRIHVVIFLSSDRKSVSLFNSMYQLVSLAATLSFIFVLFVALSSPIIFAIFP